MGKIIDITEKLSYEENPEIIIKGEKIKVNDSAETVLRIMGVLSEGENTGPKEIMEIYNMIFSKEDRKKIESLKLNFKDFQTLINAAIELITGDSGRGEQRPVL